MKDRDWVVEGGKVGVESERVAEGFPLFVPDSTVGLGPRFHNAGEDLLLHSAEITAELIAGLRWHKRQDVGCGYFVLK